MAVEIVVTGSYNDKDIKRAMRDLNKMSDEAGGTSKSISEKFSALAGSMENVGRKMTATVTLPIVAAGAAAFAAFAEEEAAIAKMQSVIKSTGGVAGVTSEHVQNLASSLQKTTTFADDATINAAALALTFKNLRNEAGAGNDVFDRTIKASQDMATVMGTDLNSATMMISKALNEPAEGLSKLSRAGVQFTSEQENMIKTMVASGDTLGAQKVILGELESQFGGAAEAVAQTSSGKLKQSLNDLGDSAEKVGGIIAPVIDKISGFLKGLADRFNALSPSQQEFIVKALAVAAAIGPALIIGAKFITVLTALKPVILGVKGAMIGLNAAMLANPVVLIIAAVVALIAGLVLLYAKVEGFRNFVDSAFRAIADTVSWVWNNVWKPIFTKIGEIVKMVWENILKPAFQEIAKFFVTEIQPRLELLRAKFQEVWPKIQEALGRAWEFMRPILEKVMKFIGEVLVNHLRTMFEIWKLVFAGIEVFIATWWPVISAVFNAVVDIFANVIIPIIRNLWATWSAIFSAISTVVSTVFGFIAAIINNVVVPVFNFLVGVVRSVWGGISGAIGGAWGFISGVFNSIKGGIENVASFFSGAAGRIGGVFSGIGETIRNAFSSAFQFVKDLWNRTLGGRGFTIPGWVPGIGGNDFRFPTFAKGGVVPGIPGTPVPAIVHAGEMILRRQQVDNFAASSTSSSGAAQYSITVNVAPGANPVDTGRAIVDAIKAYERSNTASWRGAA